MTSDLAEVLPMPPGRKLRAVPNPDASPPADIPATAPPRASLIYEDGEVRVSRRPPGLHGPFLPVPGEYVIDGARLREARSRQGASIVQLAEHSGVGRRAIGRLEHQSRATCRTGTLIRLCNALEIRPSDLEPAPDPTPAPGQERVAV